MLQEQFLSFALLGPEWVLWLLVIMSVLCGMVTVERLVYMAANKTPVGQLQSALGAFLKDGDAPTFQKALDGMKGLEARVLVAGIEAAVESGPESAEEAIAGTLIFERSRLDKWLIILGTTGSNAPFIGLFGTVLGIIKAFRDLAMNQAEAADAVMAGISEALVATAIGLLVAIPAVMLFNFFQRRVKLILANTESLSHLVLARLKSHDRPAAAPALAEGA